MSRNLKRVPLDFAWPIDKVWDGYINPHGAKNCASCQGRGATAGGQWLEAIVQLLMIAGEDSRRRRLHPYLSSLMNRPDVFMPSSDLGELTVGLAGRDVGPFGHDAIDRWTAQKKIVKAAGLPKDWGVCQYCDGHGSDPDAAKAAKDWTRTEPPAGDGYQLWEDCSEGSPVSPVFPTLDDLCAWAEGHATTFGSQRATAAEWKRMLEDGLVFHQDGLGTFI
jgi:hypothetical protein